MTDRSERGRPLQSTSSMYCFLKKGKKSVFVTEAGVKWLVHTPLVEGCFTSTETVGLLGMGAQNGHLDFHTTPEV